MLFALTSLPAPADMISGIGAFSSPWFQEFLPYVLFAIGVFVAVALLSFIISVFRNGIDDFLWFVENLVSRGKLKQEEDTSKAITLHRRFQKVLKGRGIHTSTK